jgi:sulfocyanin SoxE-like protein
MRLARPLILLTILAACTPNSQTAAERRAEAARADSSAAGYDVAVVGTHTPAAGAAHAPLDSASDSLRRGSPGTPGGTITNPVLPGGVVIPPPLVTPPHVATQPGHRPAVTIVDTARRRRGGGEPTSGNPGATGLPPMDPELEATFLTFDEVKKTATFQLAAGNELGSQISLNGVQRGGRTLTVPIGWRVGIEFTNHDAELPHSATIVAGAEPIPEQLPPPAFPNAQTDKVDEGLLEGDSDVISFIADRAGRYLIACGVLGHAQRGQWIILAVSATATVPTYR